MFFSIRVTEEVAAAEVVADHSQTAVADGLDRLAAAAEVTAEVMEAHEVTHAAAEETVEPADCRILKSEC